MYFRQRFKDVSRSQELRIGNARIMNETAYEISALTDSTLSEKLYWTNILYIRSILPIFALSIAPKLGCLHFENIQYSLPIFSM